MDEINLTNEITKFKDDLDRETQLSDENTEFLNDRLFVPLSEALFFNIEEPLTEHLKEHLSNLDTITNG